MWWQVRNVCRAYHMSMFLWHFLTMRGFKINISSSEHILKLFQEKGENVQALYLSDDKTFQFLIKLKAFIHYSFRRSLDFLESRCIYSCYTCISAKCFVPLHCACLWELELDFLLMLRMDNSSPFGVHITIFISFSQSRQIGTVLNE